MNAELKKEILKAFDSVQMRAYLDEHFDELKSFQIIDILLGVYFSLETKLNIFEKLALAYPSRNYFPEWFCDYEPWVDFYRAALEEINTFPDEQTVFLVMRYTYPEHSVHSRIKDCNPFFSFDDAIRYISEKSWIYGDDMRDTLTWFEIEKWTSCGNGNSQNKWTYLALSDGTVIGVYADDFDSIPFCDNANLNLPVPFHTGDIITIDCRPFAPVKHGIILDIGDNRDCCSVQCAYVKDDGSIGQGALKHADVFDRYYTPDRSLLYRAELFKGELLEDEKVLIDLAENIWYNNTPLGTDLRR